MDRLTVRTETDGTIVVAGEIDASTADVLSDAVSSSDHHIRIDLAGCEFMDSSGIAALLAARSLAEERGTSLTLVAPSTGVLRLLEMCALDDVFDMDAPKESSA